MSMDSVLIIAHGPTINTSIGKGNEHPRMAERVWTMDAVTTYYIESEHNGKNTWSQVNTRITSADTDRVSAKTRGPSDEL